MKWRLPVKEKIVSKLLHGDLVEKDIEKNIEKVLYAKFSCLTAR